MVVRRQIALDPERGLTITTTSVVDFEEARNQVWFQGAITPVGTLKLGTSIRGDAFTRGKRAAAVARFLMYFTRGAVEGMFAP